MLSSYADPGNEKSAEKSFSVSAFFFLVGLNYTIPSLFYTNDSNEKFSQNSNI